MNARQQAREAVLQHLTTPMQYDDGRGAADAASDVWEPLLRGWLAVHNEPCWYDHHGSCQAHFLEEDCIVKRTRRALDG